MRCAASWVTLTDRVCEGEAPRMEKEKNGDLLMRLLAAPGKAQQDADLSRIGRIPGEEIPEVLGKELPEHLILNHEAFLCTVVFFYP